MMDERIDEHIRNMCNSKRSTLKPLPAFFAVSDNQIFFIRKEKERGTPTFSVWLAELSSDGKGTEAHRIAKHNPGERTSYFDFATPREATAKAKELAIEAGYVDPRPSRGLPRPAKTSRALARATKSAQQPSHDISYNRGQEQARSL
jgi:hypothetical protein